MDNSAGNVGAGGGTGHLEGHKRIPWTGERSEKSGAAGCLRENCFRSYGEEKRTLQGRDTV